MTGFTKSLGLAVAMACATIARADTVFFAGELNASSPTYVNLGGSNEGSGVHHYQLVQFTVNISTPFIIELSSQNTVGSPSNALHTSFHVQSFPFNPESLNNSGPGSNYFHGYLTHLPGPYLGMISSTATGSSNNQPSSRISSSFFPNNLYTLVISSYRPSDYVVLGAEGGATGSFYCAMAALNPGAVVTIVPSPGALPVLGAGLLLFIRRRRA